MTCLDRGSGVEAAWPLLSTFAGVRSRRFPTDEHECDIQRAFIGRMYFLLMALGWLHRDGASTAAHRFLRHRVN